MLLGIAAEGIERWWRIGISCDIHTIKIKGVTVFSQGVKQSIPHDKDLFAVANTPNVVGVVGGSVAVPEIEGEVTAGRTNFEIMDGRRVVPEFFKTRIDTSNEGVAVEDRNVEAGLVEAANIFPADPTAAALPVTRGKRCIVREVVQ
jgi:hypothetical protein